MSQLALDQTSSVPTEPPLLIRFTVHGKAEPAGSKVAVPQGARWGVKDANNKAAPWKKQVAQIAGDHMRSLGAGPLDAALKLDLVFRVERPKGHYGKRGVLPSAPRYPTVRPDVTKLVRGVEDALTGICWRDDAQVVLQTARKLYAHPGEPIGVDIFIQRLQPYTDHEGA